MRKTVETIVMPFNCLTAIFRLHGAQRGASDKRMSPASDTALVLRPFFRGIGLVSLLAVAIACRLRFRSHNTFI